MLEQYQGLIHRTSVNKRVSTYSLLTICSDASLTDEIINVYFQLIKKWFTMDIHIFNTFFFAAFCNRDYKRIKRWRRKVDKFAKELGLYYIVKKHGSKKGSPLDKSK